MGMDGLAGIVLGRWAGESSRGTAKTPPLQSGADAAIAMIGIAAHGHAFWPYAASGVSSQGDRGQWAWTGWRESFLGGGRGNLRGFREDSPAHPSPTATNAQTVPPSCRLPTAYRRHLLSRNRRVRPDCRGGVFAVFAKISPPIPSPPSMPKPCPPSCRLPTAYRRHLLSRNRRVRPRL